MNSKDIEKFRKKQLDAINNYRAIHGVGPLVMDLNINNDAQAWAQHLALIGRMEHCQNNKYGENIAAGYPLASIDPAKMWYSEVSSANYANIEQYPGCLHFTQLIWKASEKIGIGIAKSNSSEWWYIVAHFDLPGNIHGRFTENVLLRT